MSSVEYPPTLQKISKIYPPEGLKDLDIYVLYDKRTGRNTFYHHHPDDGKIISSKSVEIGTNIELEHTTDYTIARYISFAHIIQKSDYYSLLVRYVE